MKTLEKRAWVILFGIVLLIGVAWAAETAPYIVWNSTGSPLHILDTSGYIQNSGAKQMTSTSSWVVKNSAGTAVAGFAANGALLVTSTDNISATALVAGAGETNEVTATFATAEADTNYRVLAVLEDTGTTTARAWVRRRNTTSVVFASDNASATGYVTWAKFRTQ